jgi:hypothetical protein
MDFVFLSTAALVFAAMVGLLSGCGRLGARS